MQQHKGWSEEQIRKAIRRTTPGVRDVLAYVAAHPGCLSSDIADGWDRYDFPDWVRSVVHDELGVR